MSARGSVARLLLAKGGGDLAPRALHVKNTDSIPACVKNSIGVGMPTHHGCRCMSSRNCLLGRRFVIGCSRDGEAGEDWVVVKFGTKV